MSKVVFYMNLSGFAAVALLFFMPLLNCCTTTGAQIFTPHGVYTGSYVAQINVPFYDKEEIKLDLQHFNDMAKPIVKFAPDDIEDPRPIVILEHHFTDAENKQYTTETFPKGGGQVLGLTLSTTMYCNIFLNDTINNEILLNEVLIHEYLHCFGYGHDESTQHDLMNAARHDEVPEENFRTYAKRLEEFLYGK